ncbi:DNA-3-methyladenine glycosylase [Microbacterium gorillae]|uniref:DNA-3-methyladenine glycosylase n=1 Tax=Microbacterium gorillae TaxID=1231063 RepID=UPI00058D7952|nr:DNA-3-methyladenine glycosylase [Microbacterium gorillae]
MTLHRATRDDLAGLPVDVAPRLLGGVLTTTVDGAEVALRLTEVEAYHGRGTGPVADPGSHARMGPTARNATMWGEPGHLYVYLSHGIHSCVNVVCAPEGVAGGILLRAASVERGTEIARERRQVRRGGRVGAAACAPTISDRDLARGPGRLGQASGLRHPGDDGLDAVTGLVGTSGASAVLELPDEPAGRVRSGPRVGVAGHAGTAAFPWRFWLDGEPTVSAFRPGRGAA